MPCLEALKVSVMCKGKTMSEEETSSGGKPGVSLTANTAQFVKNKNGENTKKRRRSVCLNESSSTEVKKSKGSEIGKEWTEKEDYILKSRVKKYGQNWTRIASEFPERTSLECFNRWFEFHQPKKGTWTPEEDAQLLKRVQTLPVKSWGEIAAGIVGRTAKQCRERWCYNLDPNINKNIWTAEEDAVIIETQQLKGNRWAYIASMLPGRTENAVKTRFKSILRAKRREWSQEEDDKILRMQNQIGCQWDVISKVLPNRTKNAVKIRFRALSKGLKKQTPKKGAPNQALHKAINLEKKLTGVSTDKTMSPKKPSIKMPGASIKAEDIIMNANNLNKQPLFPGVLGLGNNLMQNPALTANNAQMAMNNNLATLVQNQIYQANLLVAASQAAANATTAAMTGAQSQGSNTFNPLNSLYPQVLSNNYMQYLNQVAAQTANLANLPGNVPSVNMAQSSNNQNAKDDNKSKMQ